MADLTRDGEQLVSNYMRAVESLARCKQQVTGAECDLSNAESALAKWLMPSDMKPGEKIAVWRGDSLFQVELVPQEAWSTEDGGKEKKVIDHVPKITVRTRGKHFYEMRLAV